MWHHRHLRHARAPRNRSRDALAHERVAAPPRARRGRVARRAGCGTGASAAVDHRSLHRAAAAVQRGSQRLHRLQRRGLQLPGADRRADCAGLPVSYQERHRSDRPRLGSLGRGLRRAPARHVRVRAVGPQPRDPVPRARPAGGEAAALRAAARRHAAVRLRDQVDARARRTAARRRSSGRRGILRAGLRRRAADDLPRRAQAPARPHTDDPAWPAGPRAARILGRPFLVLDLDRGRRSQRGAAASPRANRCAFA